MDHACIAREPLNRNRKRRREQQRLSGFGTLPQDLFDVWTKSDVQHPIGFIKHDDFQIAHLQQLTAHQIDDSPRSADDELRPFFQLAHLLANRATTDATGRGDLAFVRQSFGFIGNLLTEFSRGRQDQCLSARIFEIQQMQNRQDECCRFTGTGTSLSDAVAAGQGDRDKCGLNGTWLSKSRSRHREQ